MRGILFSSGGFSARYGDALSAVADVQMAGKPIRDGLRVTASVSGLSGDLSREVSGNAGFRVSAGHTNAGLFLQMNCTSTGPTGSRRRARASKRP